MDVIKGKSDYLLEIAFSFFRWFFLVLSTVLFIYYHLKNPEQYNIEQFAILAIFGAIYMAVAEITLHKANVNAKKYKIITRLGVLFDFIAFFWLISLTGGEHSILFPAAYLIILHASVYWGFKGGLLSATFFTIGYVILLFTRDYQFVEYYTNLLVRIFFLYIVGFLGGLIISQERKHFIEKIILKDIATKDFLTNLKNHRSFQEILINSIKEGQNFFLVLCDIDYFKEVNDRYGHVTGDQVLQDIGHILNLNLPPEIGIAFRYGGEEFAFIIYTESFEKAEEVIARIKQQIDMKSFSYKNQTFSITLSYGAVKYNGENYLVLIDKADNLLYKAKQNGRNQVVWEESLNIISHY